MGKLFSITGEKTSVVMESAVVESSDEIPTEALSELLVEGAADLALGIDATQMAVERFEMLSGMQEHMQEQKLCSGAYMASMESYSPVVQAFGARMGVKTLPALEDFANPYAAKVCHSVAMEGFKEWISKAWEKIKSFFRDFFKKIDQFLKRIVKANLELETYEKHCEHLIAKLNAHNAKITDNRAKLSSQLPRLLANRGDTEVSPDFILNDGRRKINNFLKVTEDLIKVNTGMAMATRLKEFYDGFKGFVERNKSATPDSADQLEVAINSLKDKGHLLISGIFPNRVSEPNQLPPKAYEAVASQYSGAQMSSSDFFVYSLAEVNDPYKELPQGTNMVLAYHGKDNFYISVARDDPAQVANYIEPIASLNNLTTFYKDYKSTLGKLNLSLLAKASDQVSDEVDKILNLLQRDFGGVVEKAKGLSLGKDVESLIALITFLKQKDALKDRDSLAEFINPEAFNNNQEETDVVAHVIDHMFKTLIDNPNESMKRHTDRAKTDPNVQKGVALAIDGLKLKYESILNSETDEARKKLLVDFNKYLTNLFTRLQSLYRTLMTDFYGSLTTVRYEVIKYIYDSAKLYTY